ncbi:hypothetical protein ACFW1A_32435 [Kitasatospora sp. NPDC058965]|uniref:hypothetical protein n=1 Tax=Kitasatospora sp. NPDC058965 TaxID=3346682 RepID=UPI00369EA339
MLSGVTALLLAGCSGTGSPTAGGAAASASAQPTAAVASSTVASPAAAPPTPEATPVSAKVVLWYGTGGVDKLDALIHSVAEVQAQHDAGRGVIDLNQASQDLRGASAYSPIPDQDTQTAWSTALQHLGSGMDAVLSVSILNPGPTMAPEQAKETETRGWAEFGTGVAGLKDVDSRLQAFGCLPHGNPWDV